MAIAFLDEDTRHIFDSVREAAVRHGHCDPQWLRLGQEPAFQTVEDPGATGPELILLHGLFGALSNWDAVFPRFAKFSRPISLNFPLLRLHRSEVRVKALSAYTEFFVRKRKIAPVALCGNSMGGHVALRLCLASPELVDCLILTGASGLYEHSVDTLPVRPDHRFVREHMKRVFFNQEFVTEEAIQEIAGILTDRLHVLNLIHAARSAKKDNLERVLKQIKVPTLLLWGEDDEITTMDVAETFHKCIPHSTLISIKNCGHAPMIEHPEWFAEKVEGFIREHSRHFKS